MNEPSHAVGACALLHIALPLEARAWIDALGLKRAQNLGRWEVYANASEGTRLIISGVGMTRAAAAVGAACAAFQPARILSFGLAGAPLDLAAKGDVRLIHAIHDQTTGRAFYPDLLEKHPFAEAAVTTWPRRVTTADAPATLVDMEASGVWQAASAFLPPHRIAVVKVVSDHLESGDLDVKQVAEWLVTAVAQVALWWRVGSPKRPALPAIPSALHEALLRISTDLQLTTTQHHQLRRDAEDAFCRKGHLPEVLANWKGTKPAPLGPQPLPNVSPAGPINAALTAHLPPAVAKAAPANPKAARARTLALLRAQLLAE